MKRWIVLAALVLWLAGQPSPAPACKFCCWSQAPTLRQEAANARIILYGTVANPRQGRDGRGNPTPDGIDGTTDFRIERSLKTDPIIGTEKLIELPRDVAVDKETRFLIFFDVFKGKIDPYKGVTASPAIVDYLQGMLALDQKNSRQILAYAFRYLEHPDKEIAEDAFREFMLADYRDYRDLAPKLLPDLLARWLQDPKVPAARKGRYALLLGHCGSDRDADLLRRLIEEARKEDTLGLDQVLIGYALLRPKDAWAYTQATLKDRSQVFLNRYRAQLALRFFWEQRPELVVRKDLLEGICLALDHEDMADLAIEDLRRWQQWEPAARILALQKKNEYWQVPILRRAVLRYALCCPGPEAARFVEQMRKRDREKVEEAEEILRLDKGDPPKAAATDS